MQNNPYQADRIGQIIGMLDEEESGWRRCIKENDESCIKDLERFREYITDLLFEIKEYIKSADSQEKISIQDFIHDSLLADHLMDQARRLLVHYRAMAPLRILEKDDLHLCQDFFTYAMENYVNRLDMKCLDRFEDYKFQNYEEMQNALESLDVLSGYYVSKSFSGQTIREDFGDETGLSPVLCEHYATLINESYQTIRLNTIFQKVDLLEKKIDQLLERI